MRAAHNPTPRSRRESTVAAMEVSLAEADKALQEQKVALARQQQHEEAVASAGEAREAVAQQELEQVGV